MTYSCALFEEGTETLEQAQDAKLELICAKLGLQPGQRVLDIGCGWGSFAIHAAREHGVSVWWASPSRRHRPSSPGSGCATRGWRTGSRSGSRTTASSARSGSTPSSASGWSSTSARRRSTSTRAQIARVLEPDGAVLNHGIVRVAAQEGGAHLGGEFSNRYVFPDGELLNLSRMQPAFERAGLETLHIENLHTDYAETLRHWITRLDHNLDEAERLAGAERLRVWRLYLRAARNSFETGDNAVYQMLCTRPLTEAPSSTPTGARREPAGAVRPRRAPLSRAPESH